MLRLDHINISFRKDISDCLKNDKEFISYVNRLATGINVVEENILRMDKTVPFFLAMHFICSYHFNMVEYCEKIEEKKLINEYIKNNSQLDKNWLIEKVGKYLLLNI